jgi:hypothetical protein
MLARLRELADGRVSFAERVESIAARVYDEGAWTNVQQQTGHES